MGDKVIVWNPKRENSVKIAQQDYAAMKAAGYQLVDKRHNLVKEFDPKIGWLRATQEQIIHPDSPPSRKAPKKPDTATDSPQAVN